MGTKKPVVIVEASEQQKFEDECKKMIEENYVMRSSSCGFIDSQDDDFYPKFYALFIDRELYNQYNTEPSNTHEQSCNISPETLEEIITTMKHARTFITARQKMNPVGVQLYDELLERLENI